MTASILWREGRVRFLDQALLPLKEEYRDTDDYRVIASAIRSLSIRGAPLIGVAAAYGVALAAAEAVRSGLPVREEAVRAIEQLRSTRPTAVNLFWALARMQRVVETAPTDRSAAADCAAEAARIHREDEEMCRAIGVAGAALIPAGATALTHCNAGALATGGEGTALSVLFAAHRAGTLRGVYVCETRPALQGARLTTWELMKAGIDATLITDSTAASLMKRRKIDLVIVGADRIAANGDTVNKIGTYMHAVTARHHGIPLYVAAPGSTIDASLPDGSRIPIEERSPTEVTEFSGVRLAPPGVAAYAPAFDLTESSLIAAIITERGVFRPPYHFSPAAESPVRR